MEYKTILFDVQDGVAHITLNRPEVSNVLNSDLAKDLMLAAIRCDEDPLIRAVLITGSGNVFCAGGDLKDFKAHSEDLPSYFKEITTYIHAAISRFTRMDPPVVAAVHGAAAGAGMSLACICDIVLAAENTRFIAAYTRAGLTPDCSFTYFLPRIVGLKAALELTLTNRVLSAKEAFDLGIVTRVVPEAELLSEAKALAVQLAAGPTKALGASKRLLHSGWMETLETQMENETQTIARMGHTSDSSEGITAFIEKRAPKYEGK